MADRRRKSDRRTKRILVRYGSPDPQFIGHTRNLSATGMSIEGRQAFSRGTLLHMTVGESPELVTGRVMWTKAVPTALVMAGKLPTMGVTFEGPPPKVVAELQAAAGPPTTS
jgi:hypothetical protein